MFSSFNTNVNKFHKNTTESKYAIIGRQKSKLTSEDLKFKLICFQSTLIKHIRPANRQERNIHKVGGWGVGRVSSYLLR